MGRSMIIICAGVMIAVGVVGIASVNRGKQVVKSNAGYAEIVRAKNAAHTAIQIAMQEINADTGWAENHPEGAPYEDMIGEDSVELYVEYIYSNNNNFWQADTMRMVSKAWKPDPTGNEPGHSSRIVSVYAVGPISTLVPDFVSPMAIAADSFTISAGGSASLSGIDQGAGSPLCTDSGDQPGMTVSDSSDVQYAEDQTSSNDIEGDPRIDSDTTLTYEPTDQLIERLANSGNVEYITGNYKGSLGTPDEPGVFFIEEDAKLTGGIEEGYGILVIRSLGELSYEDSTGTEVEIAGNFKFNGLVIFENAFNLTARGTPDINGSVLIGNTEEYLENGGDPINIDLSGNFHIQNDCRGEHYAKVAAALAVRQNRYQRVVTFE